MRRGTINKPSEQCCGQISSRRIRNQQRSAAHQRNESCVQLGQLASTCNRIRNLCRQGAFIATKHKTIMGYLEKRASRFRKNGWMGGEDIEEIIKKLQEEEGNERTEEGIAGARVSEQEAVKEAMKEGLLQPHGIPPNSKQDRIFRILCENPNGLNNQITGNQKLGKAIDIKDKLGPDRLLFCKHRLNLHHKDNKDNFKQMFQRKVA
jgi:hypothetical protein